MTFSAEINLGYLIDGVERGAENSDPSNPCCGALNKCRGYSLIGRKVHYLQTATNTGLVIGIATALEFLAGLVACLAVCATASFSFKAALIWGASSTGAMTLGFGGAGITGYLAHQERNKMITKNEAQKLLDKEEKFNSHDKVKLNVEILQKSFGIN